MDAVTPGYKLTDAGVIPEGWEAVRLGDIARIGSGTTPSRNQHALYFAKGTIAWIKTGDLNNSELEATDESVTEVARVECNLTIYPVGTVVIAMYGGFNQIGRTGLLTVPATVNQALSAVCPDAKRIDSKYLIHYLNFFVDRWKDIASSSRKDPNITRKDVSTFQIALPPLAEQRAIAAVLGDLDGLIAASGRGIAKRRDLKQAAMQQLLTGRTRLPGFAEPWATRKLGDCLEPVQSGVSVRSVGGSDGERQAGPRILKTSAVSDGDFDESETKPIAPEDLCRARLCPKADTILMSRMNTVDLVGECGYVPRDIADVFIPDRLWRIEKRIDAQVDMKWLTAMLAHSHLKSG